MSGGVEDTRVEVAANLLGYVKASFTIPVRFGDVIFSELGCKPLCAIVTNHKLIATPTSAVAVVRL